MRFWVRLACLIAVAVAVAGATSVGAERFAAHSYFAFAFPSDSLIPFEDGLFFSGAWLNKGESGGFFLNTVERTMTLLDSTIGVFGNDEAVLFDSYLLYLKSNEVWVSDGTVAGTRVLLPSQGESAYPEIIFNPDNAQPLGHTAYILVHDYENNEATFWKSTGTPESNEIITTIPEGDGQYIYFSGQGNGRVYFSRQPDESEFSEELWVSDGTAAGTKLLRFFPNNLIRGGLEFAGAYGYFRLEDAVGGETLWRTDGTAQGTASVLELWEINGFPDNDYISYLHPVGSKMMVSTTCYRIPCDDWKHVLTDGTAVGTYDVSFPGHAAN